MFEAISLDCRADARSAKETRLLRQADLVKKYGQESFGFVEQIRFGRENGQVMVRIGQTKVITQSVLKIISPRAGKPNEGDLKINIDFAALGHSAEFNQQTNTVSEMRVEISNFIDKVLKSSRATDREGLCIIQGKLAWSLTVEMQLLNDDGNLIDAFFMAAVLALKNTRLPEVSMKGDNILLNNSPEKQHYLNVHHIPVCTTFYFIPKMEFPIVDASAKEERLASARLSICMNVFEDVCGIQTLGQMEIDPMQLLQCTRDALDITKQTTKVIRAAWASRDSDSSLLAMTLNGTTNTSKGGENRAQMFIDQLNQGLNQEEDNNVSEDDSKQQKRSRNIKEHELIDLIKKNKKDGRQQAMLGKDSVRESSKPQAESRPAESSTNEKEESNQVVPSGKRRQ